MKIFLSQKKNRRDREKFKNCFNYYLLTRESYRHCGPNIVSFFNVSRALLGASTACLFYGMKSLRNDKHFKVELAAFTAAFVQQKYLKTIIVDDDDDFVGNQYVKLIMQCFVKTSKLQWPTVVKRNHFASIISRLKSTKITRKPKQSHRNVIKPHHRLFNYERLMDKRLRKIISNVYCTRVGKRVATQSLRQVRSYAINSIKNNSISLVFSLSLLLSLSLSFYDSWTK
jgi:hypothetical protein